MLNITASPDWSTVTVDHTAAVTGFVAAARAVPDAAWLEPIAPGKWSPAEITAHVIQAYSVLRRELAGGEGMRLRGSRFRRWIFRQTILRRLLRGGGFPAGAPAPREIRPSGPAAERSIALAELERVSSAFAAELTERAAAGPVTLSHAYFGRMPALDALRLSAVHTRHHAAQLSAIARPD